MALASGITQEAHLLGRQHYPLPWAEMGCQQAEWGQNFQERGRPTSKGSHQGGYQCGVSCRDLEDQKILSQTARDVKTSEQSGAPGPVEYYFVYI